MCLQETVQTPEQTFRAFNQRYHIIDDWNGKGSPAVVTETTVWSFADFIQHENAVVLIRDKYVPVAKLWLKSPLAHRYAYAVYDRSKPLGRYVDENGQRVRNYAECLECDIDMLHWPKAARLDLCKTFGIEPNQHGWPRNTVDNVVKVLTYFPQFELLFARDPLDGRVVTMWAFKYCMQALQNSYPRHTDDDDLISLWAQLGNYRPFLQIKFETVREAVEIVAEYPLHCAVRSA